MDGHLLVSERGMPEPNPAFPSVDATGSATNIFTLPLSLSLSSLVDGLIAVSRPTGSFCISGVLGIKLISFISLIRQPNYSNCFLGGFAKINTRRLNHSHGLLTLCDVILSQSS